jgi:UDP-3-O-[3-hydroxymyristoyl] glucosamine N-acyltransferase
MKLSELAGMLKAELSGPGDLEISGVAGVGEARAGQITFITGSNYLKSLDKSQASASIVPLDTPGIAMPVLRVKNPKLAFARLLEIFYVKPSLPTGVSSKASIGKDVIIGADCSIHPFVVLADGVRLGRHVTIHPGSFVGEGSIIDEDTVVHANVSIGSGISLGKRVIVHSGTVIGSDGFGFVTDGGRHHKVPQVGGVIIEDDVEIGANCAIDRATLGNTMIKKGTKIDNHVHIAHNCTIGEHCLFAAQTGIAGSTTIGNYVVFGGSVGVGDHVKVGDRVMAGGKAVIVQDVEAGQVIAGFNAMPLRDWLKVQVILPRLPELKKMLAALEKQVEGLKKKVR